MKDIKKIDQNLHGGKKTFTYFLCSEYYVAVVYGSLFRRQSTFSKICDLKMIFKIPECNIKTVRHTLVILSKYLPID